MVSLSVEQMDFITIRPRTDKAVIMFVSILAFDAEHFAIKRILVLRQILLLVLCDKKNDQILVGRRDDAPCQRGPSLVPPQTSEERTRIGAADRERFERNWHMAHSSRTLE